MPVASTGQVTAQRLPRLSDLASESATSQAFPRNTFYVCPCGRRKVFSEAILAGRSSTVVSRVQPGTVLYNASATSAICVWNVWGNSTRPSRRPGTAVGEHGCHNRSYDVQRSCEEFPSRFDTPLRHALLPAGRSRRSCRKPFLCRTVAPW